jgi:hypothetical protein
MNIQTANHLFSNGTLSEMYKAGFITEKFFTYREIYLWVHAQMQTHKLSKNKAVVERTIWRAINSFSGTDTLVSPL